MNKDENQVMVTILCLAYNHAAYIRQCLEGFVMQKTDFCFEAIVHDDASADGTAAIIKEYADKYPDIIKPIFETENQYSKHDGTIGRVMRENTHGKYVAMCEGDDYWIDPQKLQKQVDFLESHPDYSMCFHNAIKYYENDNKVELFNLFSRDCDLSIHDAVHHWLVPTASILIRATVCKNRPAWIHAIYSGDYELILRAMLLGKVRSIHDIMSFYRINYNGTSASARMRKRYAFVLEQRILLLTSFLGHVDNIFSYEIQFAIKGLRRELRFQRYKDRQNILGILLMPQILSQKICRKVKSWLFKTV